LASLDCRPDRMASNAPITELIRLLPQRRPVKNKAVSNPSLGSSNGSRPVARRKKSCCFVGIGRPYKARIKVSQPNHDLMEPDLSSRNGRNSFGSPGWTNHLVGNAHGPRRLSDQQARSKAVIHPARWNAGSVCQWCVVVYPPQNPNR
jgi:hypothetical protein